MELNKNIRAIQGTCSLVELVQVREFLERCTSKEDFYYNIRKALDDYKVDFYKLSNYERNIDSFPTDKELSPSDHRLARAVTWGWKKKGAIIFMSNLLWWDSFRYSLKFGFKNIGKYKNPEGNTVRIHLYQLK